MPRPARRRRWVSLTYPWRASRPFLLLLAALPAIAAFPGRTLAQNAPSEDMATVHDRCVAFVQGHPKEGLERAEKWRDQGGGFYAEHCIAMAMFELHDFAGSAQRFETLATKMLGLPPRQRAQLLDQAGQAWLAAKRPDRAKAAFDAALQLSGPDADLLIDRAQAFAGLQQYWDALDDLNKALDLSPERADAYIYRGAAYRALNVLDLAQQDIEHGLKLAPDSPTGLLERGNLRRLKGDIAGARSDWQRVDKLAPHTPEGYAARANLAKLAKNGAPEKAAKKPRSP